MFCFSRQLWRKSAAFGVSEHMNRGHTASRCFYCGWVLSVSVGQIIEEEKRATVVAVAATDLVLLAVLEAQSSSSVGACRGKLEQIAVANI